MNFLRFIVRKSLFLFGRQAGSFFRPRSRSLCRAQTEARASQRQSQFFFGGGERAPSMGKRRSATQSLLGESAACFCDAFWYFPAASHPQRIPSPQWRRRSDFIFGVFHETNSLYSHLVGDPCPLPAVLGRLRPPDDRELCALRQRRAHRAAHDPGFDRTPLCPGFPGSPRELIQPSLLFAGHRQRHMRRRPRKARKKARMPGLFFSAPKWPFDTVPRRARRPNQRLPKPRKPRLRGRSPSTGAGCSGKPPSALILSNAGFASKSSTNFICCGVSTACAL